MGYTLDQQIDLAYNTVVRLNNIAEDSYVKASQSLETLTDSATQLPLTLVDVDIGSSVSTTWDASISTPAAIATPSFLTTYIGALPEAPTLPTLVDADDLEATAPSAPSDTVSATITLPTAPQEPTIAELTDPAEPSLPSLPGSPSLATMPSAPDVGVFPDAPGIAEMPSAPELVDPDTLLVPSPSWALPDNFNYMLDTSFVFDEGKESTWTSVPSAAYLASAGLLQLTEEIKGKLLGALTNGQGLSDAYWDSLYTQQAGQITRETAAETRRARNSGAASYWALPAETVLSQTRRVNDAASRKLSTARLEIAKKQAEFAREDFWKVIETAMAHTQTWLGLHTKMADIAFSSAEALTKFRIDVHNANVGQYAQIVAASRVALDYDQLAIDSANKQADRAVQVAISKNSATTALFSANVQAATAKTDATVRVYEGALKGVETQIDAETRLFSAEVQAAQSATESAVRVYEGNLKGVEVATKAQLDLYAAKLQQSQVQIEHAKAQIDLLRTQWQGYGQQVDAQGKVADVEVSKFTANSDRYKAAISGFAEDVRAWGTKVQAANSKNDALVGYAKTQAELFSSQYGALSAIAAAANAVIGADSTSAKLKLDGESAMVDREKAMNAVAVQIGQLNQAAQEAAAKIDVAQAQWIEGQATTLKQNIAQLAYGYAQAAVAASDVSFGRTISSGYSQSASQNSELVWS